MFFETTKTTKKNNKKKKVHYDWRVRHCPSCCWSAWVSRTRRSAARCPSRRRSGRWTVSPGGRRDDTAPPGRTCRPPPTTTGGRRSGSAGSRPGRRPLPPCSETASRNDRENWRAASGTSDCKHATSSHTIDVIRDVARNLIWVGINGSRRQNNHIKKLR